MEKIIVLFSVPIFLLLVLLIAVFVLAHYSGTEQSAKPTPEAVKDADTSDQTKGADSLTT